MATYEVAFILEIEADSEAEAAGIAMVKHRDPEDTDGYFKVTGVFAGPPPDKEKFNA